MKFTPPGYPSCSRLLPLSVNCYVFFAVHGPLHFHWCTVDQKKKDLGLFTANFPSGILTSSTPWGVIQGFQIDSAIKLLKHTVSSNSILGRLSKPPVPTFFTQILFKKDSRPTRKSFSKPLFLLRVFNPLPRESQQA